MTTFTKTQLATILSALDDTDRNPANKAAAMAAITASAERLGIAVAAVLAAGPALLDGEDPTAWREHLLTPEASKKPLSKQVQLVAMLRSPEGATIDAMMTATGWQRHTVRGALSGALKKKLGLAVTSEKLEGADRVYRIADVTVQP